MLGLVIISTISCKKQEAEPVVQTEEQRKVDVKFTLLDPAETGVQFNNQMQEDYHYNNFSFEYMYNGGGVAVGDVNGDGLPDLYFSSSRFSNKLYINLGNFKFAEVTNLSKVGAAEGFKTGVAMIDINGDGKLDIYSCRTSKTDDGLKNDFFFMNQGNEMNNGIQVPIFKDQAKELGIVDNSNTNQSCFFDYDRDGDLDLFLVCHKLGAEAANQVRLQQHEDGTVTRITTPSTPFESDKLYRNDNGRFKDVTKEAGVTTSAFGLAVTAADINSDGWMDLYVSNDYIEPDFIFINNHDGTFTDHYNDYLKHSCQASMGNDIEDINNDGLVDIMVLDMKPGDPIRYKTLMNNMLYDRYQLLVQYGYGRQAGRNVLQLNNGNQTFSEIGQYAGVATTDWSWGVLMADYDNDGWKDIFVSNGYRKDVTQFDYLNYFRDSIKRTGELTQERFPDINQFVKFLPETKIASYLFVNDKNLQFYDATHQAGMDQVKYSNGCAYADLDADGDLDLIVNNIDSPAFIYRNDSEKKHWLQIDLKGPKGNPDAIGAYADLYTGINRQYQMMITNKGFFSNSEPILHFGIGNTTTIDSIILHWPDGSAEKIEKVAADQRLIWSKGYGKPYKDFKIAKADVLFEKNSNAVNWKHSDNDFVDSKRERLIPYNLSSEGPCLAVGDINGDQLTDIYAGNGRGYPSTLFLQTKTGSFASQSEPAIKNDSLYEDCGAVLEDFDGDNDLDLVVISGGNDLPNNDNGYMTRYYTNDGHGQFAKDSHFPIIRTNAGAVLAFDFDQDNDKDLLIAGRCTPGGFPASPKSFLLRNDKGTFTDVTSSIFKECETLGMISDLDAGDLDGDGKIELVVAGDWMPIRVFAFDGKKFEEKTNDFGLEKTNGWWKSISLNDIDDDGDLDILAGNIGLNNRFKASANFPITLVYNDFDGNNSLDPILCYYWQNKLYPFAGRDAIISQIPRLKKKFTRYTPYASATIQDIFSKEELNKSTYLYAYTFENTIFKNENKQMRAISIPYKVQLSPVYDFIVNDFNGDGKKDILMAGNYLYSDTETGEMDAGNGSLLLQQADGSFAFVENRDHGFWAQREVRELKSIQLADGRAAIITGNNRGPIEISTCLKAIHHEPNAGVSH